MIEQGKFRKDLFYRLRGVTIQLPPLRERREDIAELAHHFLDGGHSGGVIPAAEAGESGASNADMGGSDFGVNDPGSGWDDGGGFGGDSGGGGDWS